MKSPLSRDGFQSRDNLSPAFSARNPLAAKPPTAAALPALVALSVTRGHEPLA